MGTGSDRHLPERLSHHHRRVPRCAQQRRYSQYRLCSLNESWQGDVDLRLFDQKLAHWFDPSVFTAGPANYYGYGNDSRTEPNIRNDGSKNLDLALFKNTKFGPDQRLGLEFRAEFFNTLNRVQFNPPNTSCCGGASFGQITGQYNLPRVVQFALRMTF